MDRLTTAQAAQRTGASRFALSRAAKTGALHPIRDNRGGLLWDAEELDRWAGARAAQGAHVVRAHDAAHDAAQAELKELRARLADAERVARAATAAWADAERRTAAAMADLAQERARHIEDLRRILPAPEAVPGKRKTKWWPW